MTHISLTYVVLVVLDPFHWTALVVCCLLCRNITAAKPLHFYIKTADPWPRHLHFVRPSDNFTASSVIGVFTLQGGLKAVVWTDVFQSVIMLAGLVIVAVSGSIEVGGLQKVWEINQRHGRINFFEYVSWQLFIIERECSDSLQLLLEAFRLIY